MPNNMESDLNRFRKIVRGKIKQELRRFVANGELIGRQGKKSISIPLPRIDLPRFQFGSGEGSGVGQGQGEVGDDVGQGKPQPGSGEAGEGEGQHALEVDVSLEELASLLSEELELPTSKTKAKRASRAVKISTQESSVKAQRRYAILKEPTEKPSNVRLQ